MEFRNMPQWMNLEDIMLSENVTHEKTNTVWFHLYDVPRIGNFIETEYRIEVTKG